MLGWARAKKSSLVVRLGRVRAEEKNIGFLYLIQTQPDP